MLVVEWNEDNKCDLIYRDRVSAHKKYEPYQQHPFHAHILGNVPFRLSREIRLHPRICGR